MLGQNERGQSTQHLDIIKLWEETLVGIRKYSQRPIVFRKHPNQTKMPIGDYKMSPYSHKELDRDLQNAWCTVAFTTNGAVDSAINGIPVIAIDPICMAYEISSHELSEIENPKLADRQQWAYNLAYAQWSFPEMSSGECWRHFRPHLFQGK